MAYCNESNKCEDIHLLRVRNEELEAQVEELTESLRKERSLASRSMAKLIISKAEGEILKICGNCINLQKFSNICVCTRLDEERRVVDSCPEFEEGQAEPLIGAGQLGETK